MIFVTVGSAAEGIEFTRLVREMDRIAGLLPQQDVLIQYGTTDHEFRYARHVAFVPFDEALRLFREADVVVGHCGSGTVLNAVRFGKPLVVMPRRTEAGELNLGDHQIQLAAKIQDRPGVYVVHDPSELESAVRRAIANEGGLPSPSPERQSLMAAIREFVAFSPPAAPPK